MKKVMIVDGTNNFYRSYIVDPSISTNGAPIGGVKGFFKTLQKLSREIQPDQIVICWDGADGSRKRRTIVKSYKEGRKPLRLKENLYFRKTRFPRFPLCGKLSQGPLLNYFWKI